MINFVDQFLNRTTMYRLVLYYLLGLFFAALAASYFGLMAFQPLDLAAATAFITALCFLANEIFAKTFEAPTNVESVYITALILSLIISPPNAGSYFNFIPVAFWASVISMASKYLIALWHKHIFNPAALAVALTSLTIGQSATWWVGGNIYLMPIVFAGGLLVVRKIRRASMVASFFMAALVSVLASIVLSGGSLVPTLSNFLLRSPVFFFAFVMLTEPLTTPPTKKLRLAYGVLVGILFSPRVHIGWLYSTPELALIFGNIFSYAVSPKRRFLFSLKDKVRVADDTYDFIFSRGGQLVSFKPGQYLEWTLGHNRPDNRGNRRYFTIASSPTETDVRVGIKFYPDSSSFKSSLWSLRAGDKIAASQLAGDFTLPIDRRQKMVFIAGGIGITPFRSMIKFLIDNKDRRDIIVFYSNKTAGEIAYKEIFDLAEVDIGLRMIYTLTNLPAPDGWEGESGFIDERMIRRYAPDFLSRVFYVSGPNSMVRAFDATLQKMGVRKSQIVTDFFPGFV